MKLGVVILNYNDFPHTKAILEQLKRDPLAEGVVVVDNASTDGSPDRLLPYCTGKIRLLKVKKNGGYARGNNAGIRYLIKWMHPDVIAIANPDLMLPEGFLSAVLKDFAEHPEYSALTGVQKIPGDEVPPFAFWKKMTYSGALKKMVSEFWLLRKLHGPDRNQYMQAILAKEPGVYPADVLSGCLFFVRTEDLLRAGCFDEGTFLYYEEEILFHRLRAQGKRAAVDTGISFTHKWGGTTDQIFRRIDTFRMTCRSFHYFVVHYLAKSAGKRALFEAVYAVYRIEKELHYGTLRLLGKYGK